MEPLRWGKHYTKIKGVYNNKMTAESMHIKIKDLEETDKTKYKGNE